MTKIVGLTGGIGSGKTTVARMFKNLGIPTYIADEEARIITNQPETLKVIEQHFGSTVIINGQLNRMEMAKIVFNDSEKLSQLNVIIHPLVAKHFKDWLKLNNNAIFVIKETAILFETQGHVSCDFVITVTAPIEVRVRRVKDRDQSSEEEIKKRINSQYTDEQRIKLSDFVIENDNLESTKEQVIKIYNEILKSS